MVYYYNTRFHKKNWISFRTQAPELLQQTAAENVERQVDLEEVGAFIFFHGRGRCFQFSWHGFVVAVGVMNTCTTESPTCLARKERFSLKTS